MILLFTSVLVLWLQAQPSTHLADVMSKTITTAFPEQALEEVDHHFAVISGLPVIDSDHKCIGVISKKDRTKASDVSIFVLSLSVSPDQSLLMPCCTFLLGMRRSINGVYYRYISDLILFGCVWATAES